MKNVSRSISFESMFDATFPGIYKFVFVSGNVGHEFRIVRNSGSIPYITPSRPLDDQYEITLFLEHGDSVQHKGTYGTLYGVRLGDEI